MAGFGPAPVLVKIFFILLAAGFLLHLIGFASPFWSHDRYASIGLWKRCYLGYGCSKTTYYTSEFFEATQVFETLGFVAAFIGLLLSVFYIFIEQTASIRIIYINAMVSVFVAAICTILGVIIYGSRSVIDLSWAFALSVIGGLAYGVSAMIMAIHQIRLSEADPGLFPE